MPERNGFVKDEALYQSRQSYPETNYGRLTTHYLNGIGFAFSAFTPVQYVPVSGKVMFARTVKVIVKTTASRTDNSRMLWVTPNNANRAKSLAQNPEMLDSYSCRNKTEMCTTCWSSQRNNMWLLLMPISSFMKKEA